MLKIDRDKLLVAAVLTLVISIDMIQTSMLAPILPHIPNIVPFFGVVLLGLRFLYIKQYSFTFLFLHLFYSYRVVSFTIRRVI